MTPETTDALVERVRLGLEVETPEYTEQENGLAALTELAERLKAAEAEAELKRIETYHANAKRNAAEAQRDELMKALKEIEGYESRMGDYSEPEAYGVAFDCGEIARAALAKHRDPYGPIGHPTC